MFKDQQPTSDMLPLPPMRLRSRRGHGNTATRRHTLLMPSYIYRVGIWSGVPSNKLTRSSMWTDRHLKTGMLRTNDRPLCNDHILLTEFNDGSSLRSSWWYGKHFTHWAASSPPYPSHVKTLTFLIDLGIFEFSSPALLLLLLLPLLSSSCRVEVQEEKEFRNLAYLLWSSHSRCSFGKGAQSITAACTVICRACM